MAIDAQQVLNFLGRSDDTNVPGTVEQVDQAVEIVTAMVKNYTRGNGFDSPIIEPVPDLEMVIITATARLLTNPGQLPIEETTGPFSRAIRGSFVGWTLAEQAVLNRYRVRAQ